jgi:hypothetical protein
MFIFEWDAAKARRNLLKHGVSFEEARSVFHDEFAVQFDDEDDSIGERRYLMLGMSREARLLIVSHCERGEVLRIISARRATKAEGAFYEGERT